MMSKPSIRRTGVSLLVLVAIGMAAGANADERRERREHDIYRTPHMVYDDRYRHDHYYPAPGYAVSILPQGAISIGFGRGRFFFQAGVWYQQSGPRYMVVRPPVGIVVPILPAGVAAINIGGVPYYYANDTYYAQGPGGYVVAQPPVAMNSSQPQVMQQAPMAQGGPPMAQGGPPPAPAAQMQPPPGTWYYCESAKAYFPYVQACAEGWRSVPAAPPPPR